LPRFAFGTQTVSNHSEAKKAAEKMAKHALGMKASHVACKCSTRGRSRRCLRDSSTIFQKRIDGVVGEAITLNKRERDGRAELECADSEDVIHLIYVDPKFMKLW
jgi:hypothetical protein